MKKKQEKTGYKCPVCRKIVPVGGIVYELDASEPMSEWDWEQEINPQTLVCGECSAHTGECGYRVTEEFLKK